ncbi:MAG: hypothetical protein CL908_09320, partial [Deltaproteobacteria bacterium]|nr:hypothetical protein [Deltaproteobacteria bacterium]
MGSWLIMALNVALLGSCCFVVANVVTRIGAEALEPTPLDPPAPTRVEQTVDTRITAPSAILERNLFGTQLAGEVQIAEDIVDTGPVVETKLPLRLLGTAAATEETRSRAAIEDEKTRKHMVVAVGDRLEGHARVRVSAIERTRVLLDNAGKREQLALHEDQPQRRPSLKRSSRRANRTPREKNRKETLNSRLKALSGNDGKGISDILSSARIVPHYDGGEMLGMKVDAIRPDSIFEKAGLQNGDII